MGKSYAEYCEELLKALDMGRDAELDKLARYAEARDAEIESIRAKRDAEIESIRAKREAEVEKSRAERDAALGAVGKGTGPPPVPSFPGGPPRLDQLMKQSAKPAVSREEMQAELLSKTERRGKGTASLSGEEVRQWKERIRDDLPKGAEGLKKLWADIGEAGHLKGAVAVLPLKKEVAKQVLENAKYLSAVAADPGFCAELVGTALDDKDLKCGPEDLKRALGEHEAAVASKVLAKKCSDKIGEGWKGWMLGAADAQHLNDREECLAAEVYNKLWNDRKYDDIVLLMKKGVDVTQPKEMPGFSGGREGFYSGFIQPLEHVLAKYVSRIPKIAEIGDEEEKQKVAGAAKLLEALGNSGQARIMTSYEAVKDSDVMRAWEEKGGTFWGWEDIRGTYVDCARASADKKGERQLRMMDIWQAVSPILGNVGYEKLLQDPDKAVDEFVAAGEAAARLREEYKNRDEKFWEDFRAKSRSFLLRLAQQTPIGDLELAKKRGLDPDKFMGARACKEGLHWAKENNDPVFYCLDGLDIENALDYRKVKHDRMRAGMEPGGPSHGKVITFSEIREVLRNWDDLKEHVKFFEMGKFIDPQKVEGWRKQMYARRRDAGDVPAPDKKEFKDELDRLDDELYEWVDDAEMLGIVRAAKNLKLAATAKDLGVMRRLLDDATFKPLYDWNLLPSGLGKVYDAASNSDDPSQALAQLRLLERALQGVADELRKPLEDRLLRPLQELASLRALGHDPEELGPGGRGELLTVVQKVIAATDAETLIGLLRGEASKLLAAEGHVEAIVNAYETKSFDARREDDLQSAIDDIQLEPVRKRLRELLLPA
jgi:hypothetical protein